MICTLNSQKRSCRSLLSAMQNNSFVNSLEKQMPALPSLAFLLGSLYHEFATQENKFSCAEFMNDKIIKHEVRQACNAWILELL